MISNGLTLKFDIPKLSIPISYNDNILLIGSCFTEHISNRLIQHKFNVLDNPNGILFNPLSVAQSLQGYIDNKQYEQIDMFYLNELWNSWDHHTQFSDTILEKALASINTSQQQAHHFIKTANWVLITLGSAFQYFIIENNRPVANNHRAPGQWFEKKLLSIETIKTELASTITQLLLTNPNIKILFTISPVRHIRDGVIDNNRSKARLIESVHLLCEEFNEVYYFPAYELVIDILRDYRFYDIDFVHPNFLATQIVWDQFLKACIDNASIKIMEKVHEIAVAKNHRPRFEDTLAHKNFKRTYYEKTKLLQAQFSFLNMSEELNYFLK